VIRMLRSAYVIARRDFAATVLSKTFIFFLLGPLFPLFLGGVFGGIGARVATQTARPVVAIIGTDSDFGRYSNARNALAEAMGEQQVVKLIYVPPLQHDGPAVPERILKEPQTSVRAVLYGSLDDPRLAGKFAWDDPLARQMRLIVKNAQAPDRDGPPLKMVRTAAPSGNLVRDRALTAQIGQMILFFLTILLAGMLLSQLLEEKSNKIIEVIAAAVPIDSLFVGKLFAMLAASVIGIALWTLAGAAAVASLKEGGLASVPPPAVGWAAYFTLAIIYFAMNYLLLGALFLTIGAQASTVREVQTLSMPVTFAQVVIFGFAAASVGAPNSAIALGAAIFPLSSPLVMVARAAEAPGLWPHVVAIAWQLFWVGLILHVGAKMFRRTVLKSGPSSRRRWWRSSRA
jgi:ABC-2 type transport system permease protein